MSLLLVRISSRDPCTFSLWMRSRLAPTRLGLTRDSTPSRVILGDRVWHYDVRLPPLTDIYQAALEHNVGPAYNMDKESTTPQYLVPPPKTSHLGTGHYLWPVGSNDFLSTAKQGDNALGSVRPSVCPSACPSVSAHAWTVWIQQQQHEQQPPLPV